MNTTRPFGGAFFFPLNNMPAPRKQCAKCPCRKDVDPTTIPNGYDVERHAALKDTIVDGPRSIRPSMHIMACHETPVGQELPCVGWLVNQEGPGNNLGLRLAILTGQIDGNVGTVGPQHETFADTLPRERKKGDGKSK